DRHGVVLRAGDEPQRDRAGPRCVRVPCVSAAWTGGGAPARPAQGLDEEAVISKNSWRITSIACRALLRNDSVLAPTAVSRTQRYRSSVTRVVLHRSRSAIAHRLH